MSELEDSMGTDGASSELDRLVERSRRIGADPSLVVHGGGNTSTKLRERDHLGRERDVMRVKGSGTDLRTIGRDGFPGLFLDELLPLRERAAMDDDAMVSYLAHCMTDPAARRPSIETLLHAFLPARHVDHTHADAICALTNQPEGPRSVAEALGGDVAIVPYLRPGFELSKRVAGYADARAVVLAHHGLVTWGDEHERSYADTVELDRLARAYLDEQGPSRDPAPAPDLSAIDTARLLAALRERLSANGRRTVLHVDPAQRALADRPDVEAVAAGRGTPDHLLRIGVRSIVAHDAADLSGSVDAFERDYRAYFERHRERLPAGFAMLEPLPRVVLVPGLGAVAAGPNPATARVTAEIAHRSHLVTARALDAFGRTAWLSEEDVFDFDYWPMELYKLTLAPPPPDLAALVVIAPPALPAAIGEALTARGAVLAADEAAAARLGGADAVLVPSGDSLSIERPGHEAVVVDGGDPAGIGEAVAFALAGRAPLRDGAHLALR
jgi:rhamnose utilization protein RhaD (predicted bifunctional aldolase and dehydrogenase)